MITALIAEDEALLRQSLHQQLSQAWPTLNVVAVCEDGIAALAAVEQHRPRVAFLDIRMPGVTGLDVARAVARHGGLVVFITAYDDHAVDAFETGAAVDYLLKPVQQERLAAAVTRLQERLQQARSVDVESLLDQLEARLRPQRGQRVRWITASIGDSVRLIGIDEVLYFRAQDKYVDVVTRADRATIRTSLRELQVGLQPDEFWQVHRGIVVRIEAIDRLVKDELGKHHLKLKECPDQLLVSSAFLQRFRGM
jgi:DNA-binding LytR/AlgR family response regulator